MKYLISIILLSFIMTNSIFAQKTDTKFTKEDLQKASVETVTLFQQKKYEEAYSPAMKAVSISKELFGRKHIETAKNLRNLGYVQLSIDKRDKSEETFEEAFQIYKDLPDLSKANLTTAAEIAEILANLKTQVNLKSAEKYFQQALDWRETVVGTDSSENLKALSGLANISYWDREYEKSAELYKRAIEIGAGDKTLDDTEYQSTYLRGQCAYRKAKKSDEFESIKDKYFPKGIMRGSDESNNLVMRVKTISGGTVNGKAKNLPKPNYPAEARRSGASGRGKVQIEVLVNENGNIVSACALENDQIHPLLLESSEIAAYGAKFAPTFLEGKPVNVFGIIAYVYN